MLPGRPQTSLPQHERIITAIRDGDPKIAEEAMREHIASVIDALRSIDQLGGPA
ncbi:FCD domain-containing protein [Paractinoplanes durhamensis]|uniref:FCD domain-containing protein n=1 Tax=Paractinoplanes durhamensis TaxID=113563 RepID=UPI00363677AF